MSYFIRHACASCNYNELNLNYTRDRLAFAIDIELPNDVWKAICKQGWLVCTCRVDMATWLFLCRAYVFTTLCTKIREAFGTTVKPHRPLLPIRSMCVLTRLRACTYMRDYVRMRACTWARGRLWKDSYVGLTTTSSDVVCDSIEWEERRRRNRNDGEEETERWREIGW